MGLFWGEIHCARVVDVASPLKGAKGVNVFQRRFLGAMAKQSNFPVLGRLLIFLAVFGMPSAAFADGSADAAETVGHLSHNLVALVEHAPAGTAEKRAEFLTLLHSDFDLPTIGRFVAGDFWAKATPQERDAFLALYETRLVAAYAGQIENYGVDKMIVTETSAIEGSADTLVATQINRANALPVFLSWRLRKFPTGYRIIDLIVSGVSLAVTERDSLASAASRHGAGMEALIKTLQAADVALKQ